MTASRREYLREGGNQEGDTPGSKWVGSRMKSRLWIRFGKGEWRWTRKELKMLGPVGKKANGRQHIFSLASLHIVLKLNIQCICTELYKIGIDVSATHNRACACMWWFLDPKPPILHHISVAHLVSKEVVVHMLVVVVEEFGSVMAGQNY